MPLSAPLMRRYTCRILSPPCGAKSQGRLAQCSLSSGNSSGRRLQGLSLPAPAVNFHQAIVKLYRQAVGFRDRFSSLSRPLERAAVYGVEPRIRKPRAQPLELPLSKFADVAVQMSLKNPPAIAKSFTVADEIQNGHALLLTNYL